MKMLLCASMLAALVGGNAAVAQSGGYVAVPTIPPTKTNVITRSTLWKCANGTCTTPHSDERAAVLCQLAARQLGPLAAFTVAGVPIEADALARCNSRAR